jgi:putative Holliday junction resolvase
MAIAALDLGRRRIGVAIAQDRDSAAYPTGAIRRRSLATDLEVIRTLIGSRNVDRLVVGLPLNMDGSEGAGARSARSFAQALGESLDIPVDLFDERLTSFEAKERLKGRSGRGRRKKGVVDAVAAAIILDGWLQAHRLRP